MFSEAAQVGEIAPGGMKPVEVNGREIVLCNCDGSYYAIGRRCGHMNAPLDMGTLNGKILTCPLHSVQFFVDTGEALSVPVPRAATEKPAPGDLFPAWIGDLMAHVKVCNVRRYPVRIDGSSIQVDVP